MAVKLSRYESRITTKKANLYTKELPVRLYRIVTTKLGGDVDDRSSKSPPSLSIPLIKIFMIMQSVCTCQQ